MYRTGDVQLKTMGCLALLVADVAFIATSFPRCGGVSVVTKIAAGVGQEALREDALWVAPSKELPHL